MGFSLTVGGAKRTLNEPLGREVADLLDHAFGEEDDWEGAPPRDFGEAISEEWATLQNRALEILGRESIPNLLALGCEGRGVYLPTHVQAVSLPLREGEPLRCASLPGLRRELDALAEAWGISLVDGQLTAILEDARERLGCEPERAGFARLALAANEAARRDCPLWLFG